MIPVLFFHMNAENAERNLWDQIRSITQISIRLAQWGIATLLGLLTALFFIRREVAEASGIAAGHPVAIVRFITGNIILWGVAILFFRMSKWLRKRLFFYMTKLRELPNEYPNENVRVYPEIPRDAPDPKRIWQRLLFFLKITDDNRTMGVHIGTLFFFVPIVDCILYSLQWYFWWLHFYP
jgi:hypothetical protein